MLVVVSSPSGGGKGTLIRRVLKIVPDLGYSVSFTTRSPRAGEINGRHYFFVSVEEFRERAAAGAFLEWAVVHGNLYGTAHAQVERELNDGRDIILEIDVQGADSVRGMVADAVTTFILPPSFEILSERLTARGSEQPGDLALRLQNSRREVEAYSRFDYVIINDDADRAAAQLASVIYAERARLERQEEAARCVLETFTQTAGSGNQA
jgi:guanylate kinase